MGTRDGRTAAGRGVGGGEGLGPTATRAGYLGAGAGTATGAGHGPQRRRAASPRATLLGPGVYPDG